MALLSLIAKLGLDKSGFDVGMTAATRQVTKFGGELKSQLAGAFSIAALTAFASSVVQTTSRIKDLSEQFGITTEEVQKADFALKQSGLAFEDLGQAINKLGTARRSAVEGNEELRETFAKYGLTLRDLNDPQQRNFDLLMRISGALAGTNITARQQTEIMDLLGAKAGKLVNVLGELSTVKPPALFSEEDIQNIDKAQKAYEKLWLQLQVFASPAATKITQAFDAWSRAFGSGSTLGERAGAIGGAVGGFLAPTGKKLFDAVAGPSDEIEGQKPAAAELAKKFAKEIANVAGVGGLFEVDKDKKEVREEAFRQAARPSLFQTSPIQSDSLGRIGAFSGGGQQSAITDALKRNTMILSEIKNALTDRGIKIKDL